MPESGGRNGPLASGGRNPSRGAGFPGSSGAASETASGGASGTVAEADSCLPASGTAASGVAVAPPEPALAPASVDASGWSAATGRASGRARRSAGRDLPWSAASSVPEPLWPLVSIAGLSLRGESPRVGAIRSRKRNATSSSTELECVLPEIPSSFNLSRIS